MPVGEAIVPGANAFPLEAGDASNSDYCIKAICSMSFCIEALLENRPELRPNILIAGLPVIERVLMNRTVSALIRR